MSALGFAILALVVSERGAVAFDDPVTAFVIGLPVPIDIWMAITAAGGPIHVAIDIGMVLALVLMRRPWTALVYGLALSAAAAWTYVVKVTIARLRPPDALITAPGFSFPSGHALNSTVTYGLLALLVWRSDLPRWMRVATTIALASLIIVIGISRIALEVHYPSDVIGGWLAGVAIVATVAAITEHVPPTR